MAFRLLSLTLLISSLLLTIKAEVASGPAPAQLDVNSILVKGSQYNTFLRLLKETQVGTQLASQLKNTFDGITVFSPTDNAFNNLKAGTLNGLTAQEQSELVLYHILPRYYSFTTFETTSNPVRTQASGNNGVFTVNVTSSMNQVNVTTGVEVVSVNNALYSEFPLAVYSLDKVLLPADLFGTKAPAPAPSDVLAPAGAPTKGKKKAPATAGSSTAAAAVPSSEADTTTSGANLGRRTVGWGFVVASAFIGVLSIL